MQNANALDAKEPGFLQARGLNRISPLGVAPLISVIIPCYNVGRFLNQALISVEEQSYRNLEIICINDGSIDDTFEILEKHAALDSRIRLIDKENGGYGKACNIGLETARGDWIAILEPDDWIERDMYKSLIKAAKRFPVGDVDLVKSPYWRMVNPDTPDQHKYNCSYRHRIRPVSEPFAVEECPHLLCHHPSIWSAIYRADFLRENIIRFKEIPGAGWADNPFLFETLCQARIVYVDIPFYCYREETEEKNTSFCLNQSMVPFERWNDMADILDRLGQTPENHPNTWRALNERGFTYLGNVIGHCGEREDLVMARKEIFERMDPDLVFADPLISPSDKELFAEVVDLPHPAIGKAYHFKRLVGEGLYAMRNNGPAFTLRSIRGYLK